MSALLFQAWLDSEQDFQEGSELYAQHPEARPALVALFARAGAGLFTSRQLVQEIERLTSAEPPPPAPVVDVASAPAATPPALGGEQPDELAPLVAERVQLFKEASNLHGTLRHLPTDAERFKAACTIKAHFRRIDQIFDTQHYHAQHGALPPVVEAVVSDDPAELLRRRNTLRTYMSAQRGTREKRAAWQVELAQVERKLNAAL